MPSLLHLVFELGAYILAFFFLRHAWRRGRRAVLVLLAGMVYGVALEFAAIQMYEAYAYGRFLVMLGGLVPLCIGVLWGVIFYAGIEVAELLEMPGFSQVLFPALLAFSIDFGLDPVAVRLGFWSWSVSSTRMTLWQVPLYNFYIWILIPLSFTSALALGRALLRFRRLGLLGDLGLGFLLAPFSMLVLAGLFFVHDVLFGYFSRRIEPFSVLLPAAVLCLVVVTVGFSRRCRRDRPLDPVVLAVPLFFYGFCLLALLVSGFGREDLSLLALVLGMMPVSTGFFLWPYWQRLPFIRRP